MNEHPKYDRLVALHGNRLEDGERETLLRHLSGCAACRGRWLAEEPSRIFSLLSLEAIPEEALERLTRNVKRTLDTPSPMSRFFPRRYAVAAIAAALGLAAFFGVELTRRSASVSRVAQELPAPQAISVPVERDTTAQPGIELIHSPGRARVLDLSVGDTQFVMIFDEALDI